MYEFLIDAATRFGQFQFVVGERSYKADWKNSVMGSFITRTLSVNIIMVVK
jgi:hypothetical protein